MKQLIYSTGVFETEFKWEPSEEELCCDAPYWSKTRQPKYELRKISRCLIRYEIEDCDKDFIKKLDRIIDDARVRLHNETMSLAEYRDLCERRDCFIKLYQKALNGHTEEFKGLFYIEIADETTNGRYAKYLYNYNGIEWEKPHKIGEPISLKFDFNKFNFEPLTI